MGERVGEWVGEWVGERVGEWVGEKVGEWVGEKAGKWVGEWVVWRAWASCVPCCWNRWCQSWCRMTMGAPPL